MGRRDGGPDGAGSMPEGSGADPVVRARSICLRLLTARPRSRAELVEALGRRGIPEDIREVVLGRLGEVGLVDDAAFAEFCVQAGHEQRGLGTQALHADLRRRGVDETLARAALARVRPADEEQRAQELVRRRLRTSTPGPGTRGGPDRVMLARSLTTMLARRGYPEELALRVVRAELGPDGWPEELEPESG